MNHISTKINVEKVKVSKIDTIDFDNLPFGTVCSDHMFVCDYENGAWQEQKIMPYQPFTFEPSTSVFHYGQAVFEGMKAYKDDHGKVFLFRPDQNAKRINISANRLEMPSFPEEDFVNALKQLVQIESDWIKTGKGNSLYLRPFMIGTERLIAAAPSTKFKLIVVCCPVKSYYNKPVKVLVAESFSRSADGGVGFAKAAGNYAAQFHPTRLAQEKGYNQVIWTDASTHEFLEEAGTMNVFFRINDTLITAPNNDRILDGVTRKSIIQLAEDNDIDVEVRRIKISEIKDAVQNGSLKEIFGAGTAAVISPISGFEHQNKYYDLTEVEDSYASFFKNKILNIQHNLEQDPYGWRVAVN